MVPSSGQSSVIVSVGQRGQPDADGEEDQPVRGQRKGDRIAEQQEDDQAGEHDRRHVVGDELHHLRDLLAPAPAPSSLGQLHGPR